jgi:hypothetical protein
VIFVGIDWSERHHDICVLNADGDALARARVPDGIEGMAELHGLLASHAEEPEEVIVGIETDRGLLVSALVAAEYQVYAINPLSVDRYRDRHATSGAKSDPGDAKVLADIVRTDRHNHRPVAGDSELAEGGSCSPGPTRASSGNAGVTPTACARRFGSSTLQRWRPSAPSSPHPMRSRSSPSHRRRSSDGVCHAPRSLRRFDGRVASGTSMPGPRRSRPRLDPSSCGPPRASRRPTG